MRLPLPLRRWTSRHSLVGLDSPARVSLAARVASPNSVASPVTPVQAAVFRWQIFSRTTGQGSSAGAGLASYQLVESGLLGRELLLSVGEHTLLLPFPGYELRVQVPDAYGDPLERALPPGMLVHPMPPGLPCYREIPLFQGDPVLVTAVVMPAGQRGAGAYRDGAQADFIALYDHEPAVVEDQSPTA